MSVSFEDGHYGCRYFMRPDPDDDFTIRMTTKSPFEFSLSFVNLNHDIYHYTRSLASGFNGWIRSFQHG